MQQSVSVASHILEYIIEAVPYTEYVLKVAAVNSVGQGPFSSIVEIRTPEDREFDYTRILLGYFSRYFLATLQQVLHIIREIY